MESSLMNHHSKIYLNHDFQALSIELTYKKRPISTIQTTDMTKNIFPFCNIILCDAACCACNKVNIYLIIVGYKMPSFFNWIIWTRIFKVVIQTPNKVHPITAG